MHCCKRHGVEVFLQEPAASFKECMALCGSVPACQSVDYHQDTGKCSLGKHSGAPSILVAGWASAHAIGCAGACKAKSCCGCSGDDGLASGDFMGLPETGPATAATPKALSPPPLCNNQGLQWAEYPNNQGATAGGKYESFNPAVYKSQTPNADGITATVGGINSQGGQLTSVYGSSVQFPGDFFALDHKGYIFAPTTGTYKITISEVDDVVFLWTGPNALSGWDRANADLIVGLGETQTKTVDVTAGRYLPIRIMFAQGQGLAKFRLSIAAPDGSALVDSDTQQSPYVLQFSCDRLSGPVFSAWGSEV